MAKYDYVKVYFPKESVEAYQRLKAISETTRYPMSTLALMLIEAALPTAEKTFKSFPKLEVKKKRSRKPTEQEK